MHMPWYPDINWTHTISFAALGVSVAILVFSIFYNRKTIANSTKILKLTEQQHRMVSYANMINIVKKSNKGYDVFPTLRMIFDSYEGIWIDDKIKKFVDDKSKEMEEFKKESPMYRPEPEQPYTDEEMDRIREEAQQEEQEEFERLSPMNQYEHRHNERFGNVREELLRLIPKEFKNITRKINEK